MKKRHVLQARRISVAVLLFQMLIVGFRAEGGGRIVAANDDWTLSETGFSCGNPGRFAQNVCAWFTDGKPGRFLVYSTHFGLTGSSLSNAVASAGHTWIVDASASFTLTNLSTFDGVFLGWDADLPQVPPVDFGILTSYVGSGGNVYLWCGDPRNAPQWNPFLLGFGLAFATNNNGGGCDPIADSHPIFAGVTNLYRQGGTPVLDLDSADSRNQSLAGGLFGVWDPNAGGGCSRLAVDLYAGISVEGTAGAPYRLQYVNNLGDTNWTTLTDLVLPQSPYLIFDPDSPRWARRFYRVQCAPASGLVALGDALFDATSDQFPANTYRPLPAGVRTYQGYGSLAGYSLTETISYGESVAGVAAARVHFASTLPGDQGNDFWYARDAHGDTRFLQSMAGGVIVWVASTTVTPPVGLPQNPVLHQCWPSYADADYSVRDLSAAVQGYSGLLKVRIVGDDDSIQFNFYKLGVGRMVIQTSKDPSPTGSGWIIP